MKTKRIQANRLRRGRSTAKVQRRRKPRPMVEDALAIVQGRLRPPEAFFTISVYINTPEGPTLQKHVVVAVDDDGDLRLRPSDWVKPADQELDGLMVWDGKSWSFPGGEPFVKLAHLKQRVDATEQFRMAHFEAQVINNTPSLAAAIAARKASRRSIRRKQVGGTP